MEFIAPVGTILTQGVYAASAQPSPLTSIVPHMLIAPRGDGPGVGVFRIQEVQFGPGTEVQSFWATFECHYDAHTPAIVGELRYNFTPPLAVDAPLQRSVRLGETVEFDVTAPGVIEAIGLPAGATFVGVGEDVWRFAWTPLPGTVGHHRIAFRTQTATGETETTTLVQVVGETSLTLISAPGDYIGSGEQHFRTQADTLFFLFESWYVSNSVVLRAYAKQSEEFWEVVLAGPAGKGLTVARYEDAERPIMAALDAQAMLEISGNHRGCYEQRGAFTVHQIEYNPNERIRSLWATFIQRCDGSTGALTGELRFNMDPVVPTNHPPEASCSLGFVDCPSINGGVASLRARISDPETNDVTVVWETGGRTVLVDRIGAEQLGRAVFRSYEAEFPVGLSLVKLTISDSARNTNLCYTTVHCVADTEPPLITCPANIRTVNKKGRCWARVQLEMPLNQDQCGVPAISGVRSDGRSLDQPYYVGVTEVYWTASDAFSNSTNCVQLIQVDDTEQPKVICQSVSGSRLLRPNLYLLRAQDCSSSGYLYVKDSARALVYGPFAEGTYVHFFRSRAAGARSRPLLPPGAYSIGLKGDALVFTVDAWGNRSAFVRQRLHRENTPPFIK
jgi:hypothetical protein